MWNGAVNKLKVGQLLFDGGVLILIGRLLLIQMNPGVDEAWVEMALLAGGFATVLGIVILTFSREEAEAWFHSEERKEKWC